MTHPPENQVAQQQHHQTGLYADRCPGSTSQTKPAPVCSAVITPRRQRLSAARRRSKCQMVCATFKICPALLSSLQDSPATPLPNRVVQLSPNTTTLPHGTRVPVCFHPPVHKAPVQHWRQAQAYKAADHYRQGLALSQEVLRYGFTDHAQSESRRHVPEQPAARKHTHAHTPAVRAGEPQAAHICTHACVRPHRHTPRLNMPVYWDDVPDARPDQTIQVLTTLSYCSRSYITCWLVRQGQLVGPMQAKSVSGGHCPTAAG